VHRDPPILYIANCITNANFAFPFALSLSMHERALAPFGKLKTGFNDGVG